MKKVNIGIIGTGAIVEKRHAIECFRNEKINLVAFCDLNLERAQELANKYDALAYSDYNEMLKNPDIDAVIVCTSNSTHASISIEAMKNGKHVLCEKPMAMSLEECNEMIKVAKENNVKLMVAHNQRFTYAHSKAKEILDKKELGDVLWFSTTLAHPGPEYFSVQKNNTWYLNKKNSGFGVLSDLGIHKADLLMWLLGEKIIEVNCMAGTLDKKDNEGNLIDIPDNAMSLLKTERGILGTMANSYTNYGDWNNATFIYCTNGVMKIHHDITYPLEIITRDKKRTLYKDEGEIDSKISEKFVEAIIEDKIEPVTAEEARNAMKLIISLNEAAKNKQTIKIEY